MPVVAGASRLRRTSEPHAVSEAPLPEGGVAPKHVTERDRIPGDQVQHEPILSKRGWEDAPRSAWRGKALQAAAAVVALVAARSTRVNSGRKKPRPRPRRA